MVVEQHFGVVNSVLGAHENEGNTSLLPRHRRLGLVITLDFYSDNAAFVHDLLNESTVLANDFPDETSGYLIK